MNMWALTELGRRISGDIGQPKGDNTDVLYYLHQMRTASTSEIAAGCRLTDARAGATLRRLRRKGFVKELGGDA